MPLLDHFHPPLHPTRAWESMHALWIAAIAGRLNESLLPPGYFAEAEVHIGSRVEIDVATLEHERFRQPAATAGNGPVATLPAEAWAPPAPPLVLPSVFPDELEVLVLGGLDGVRVVAAIELVSPSNKDRPETRRAFATKCASYLHAGVGVVIVDVVTDRLNNLHDVLIELMELPERFRMTGDAPYVVAYRPARRNDDDQIDCWPFQAVVGVELPVVPLALRGGPTLPLDLEASYSEARRRSRL